ncbi:MAG: hypothetical protein RIG62_16830 [Cyclobacteriaceae bacterium]
MKESQTISLGYDTIKLYLDGSYYQHIENSLATQGIALQGKRKTPCGKFTEAAWFLYSKNVKVRLRFHKMKTTLSFEPAAMIYGNNFPLAGVRETKTAILALGGLLKIHVEELQVSRLDISANLPLAHKHIRDYTHLLVPPPYMKLQKEYTYDVEEEGCKMKKNGHVYFAGKAKGSNRAVVVYEKQDMMRIEMRFLKAVKRSFREMLKYHNKASALYEEDFFQRAMHYYIYNIVEKMCKESSVELESIMSQLKRYAEAASLTDKALTHEVLTLTSTKVAA